jgi:hypothetical protein
MQRFSIARLVYLYGHKITRENLIRFNLVSELVILVNLHPNIAIGNGFDTNNPVLKVGIQIGMANHLKQLQFHLLSFHYINQLFFPQFLAYRQPSKHIFLLKVLV